MELTEKSAEFAVNQLKELAQNLITVCYVLSESIKAHEGDVMDRDDYTGIVRMTTSWCALTLTKIVEIWSKYGRFASRDTVERMRAIVRAIDEKEIYKFRDKVAAHCFDKITGEPVEPERLEDMVKSMWGDDLHAFFRWLADPDPRNPNTIVKTLKAFRAEILVNFPHVRQYS